MESYEVTAGVNGVADDHNLLRKDLVLGKNIVGTESDGATITIDWSDKAKGKVRTVTIAGSRTLAFSNAVAGQFLILRVIQGGSGSYTLTYPAGTDFSYGVSPVLSTAAGDVDTIVFFATSSTTFNGFQVGTVM